MASLSKQRLGTGGFAWPKSDESRAMGQAHFLREVRRREPDVFSHLAIIAGLDSSLQFTPDPIPRAELEAWGKRWNLADNWCLATARATVETWRGPTGDLLKEPCPVGMGPFGDREAFIDALEWMLPAGVEADPLTDDEEQIPALEVAHTYWNPGHETWKQAEARMVDSFQHHLRKHRDRIQKLVEESGLERSTSRTDRHFRWLAMYQVQRLPQQARYTYATLAAIEGVELQSMEQAIKETASLIGLTLRDASRGGRPSKAKSNAPHTVKTVNPRWTRTRNT